MELFLSTLLIKVPKFEDKSMFLSKIWTSLIFSADSRLIINMRVEISSDLLVLEMIRIRRMNLRTFHYMVYFLIYSHSNCTETHATFGIIKSKANCGNSLEWTWMLIKLSSFKSHIFNHRPKDRWWYLVINKWLICGI